MKENIPVVILCGGLGTRLSEETEVRPKPLVEVGHRPILWHIMKHYARFGFNEFVLALGYKGEQIKRYFLDFYALNRDCTVSLTDGQVQTIDRNPTEPWKVHLVDTGQDALTGARLKALAPRISRGTFLMTYGDGVGDVDLTKLLAFHRAQGGLATLTAVRPPARFGALEFDGHHIRHFKEKSTLHEGWINGGFFVIEPAALDRIEGNVMWEHAPMERLAAEGQLLAYRHEGFWQCMDTLRDLRYLESLWQAGQAPLENLVNPLAQDLDHVLAQTTGVWDELRGRQIFISGGTGFVGCWLLESFAWANDQLDLGARAVVLTRNPESFARTAPHLAEHPAIRFVTGDVRTFVFPAGEFSHVIHAATAAGAGLNATDPLLMLDTIVTGTRHILDFAVAGGAQKFLFTSSGAVYGPQPPELTHISEDHRGGPDPVDPGSAYGEGKRVAELLCALYQRQHGLETKIARGFAFVGPYLPLDAHFAIGNFIGDALRGGPIQVQGDGTPHRSYLYAADLAIWLWTILARGKPGRPYNVGSAEDLTIAEVAEAVGQAFTPAVAVRVAGRAKPNQPVLRYVPGTRRATGELGLRQTIDLRDAIERTVGWQRARAGRPQRPAARNNHAGAPRAAAAPAGHRSAKLESPSVTEGQHG